MKPQTSALAISLLVAASGCASSAAPEPSAPAPSTAEAAATASATRTTAMASPGSASFTDAQADLGRDIFRAVCTECHYSSEFSDSQFKFKWSRRSAGDLFETIQTTMPETAPGSLAPEEAVALVTYILRMNAFEPGAEELAPDPTILDAISLASIRRP